MPCRGHGSSTTIAKQQPGPNNPKPDTRSGSEPSRRKYSSRVDLLRPFKVGGNLSEWSPRSGSGVRPRCRLAATLGRSRRGQVGQFYRAFRSAEYAYLHSSMRSGRKSKGRYFDTTSFSFTGCRRHARYRRNRERLEDRLLGSRKSQRFWLLVRRRHRKGTGPHHRCSLQQQRARTTNLSKVCCYG